MKTTEQANYTKKQIEESISFWERKLQSMEVAESIKHLAAYRGWKKRVLNESEEKAVKEVIDTVEDKMNDEKDVVNFVKANDEQMKEAKDPFLKRAWSMLKTIVSWGAKGLKFIFEHWKEILLIIACVCIWKYGIWNILGWGAKKAVQGALKTVEAGVEAAADGFAAVTGPEYLAAGEKISNANAAAGGYGGWTGMGLGGGLR